MVGVVGQESVQTEEQCNKIVGKSMYKDVVIIGDGPSGIVLSYFLSGNWPYYNGRGEDLNDMLHYRLISSGDGANNNNDSQKSLVEKDLIYLSQGLEGRSANPVALLFDALNHPQADLGLELPSLLNWKFSPQNAVSHVVVGKGSRPGGAWQSMDGSVLTISLGCWMELPEMNFREWESNLEKRCCRESRAPVSSVAQYYSDYVRAHHLEKNFLGSSYISEVTRVPNKCLPENCDQNVLASEDVDSNVLEFDSRSIRRRHTIGEIPFNNNVRLSRNSLWEVKGFTEIDRNVYEPFTYYAKNVVLATGASDEPNILGIPGENLPFVLHSLNDLESLIASGDLNSNSDPVIVIGAGLSAGDAIYALKFHSIPVVHLFRRSVDDPNLIFRQLPQNMYPEYHKVYQMMKDPTGYEGYKGLEQHIPIEISPNRKVKIVGPNCCGVIKASYVLICIGSHPNLSFLNGLENKIGVNIRMPIDCKRNPIDIDIGTHESVREPGLYALGPLVGENFVRFLQGGALAITSHITQKNNQEASV